MTFGGRKSFSWALFSLVWALEELGCQAQKEGGIVVELAIRQYERPEIEGSGSKERGRASDLLRILPGKMTVETNAVVVETGADSSPGGAGAEKRVELRSTAVRFFDFEGRSVWISMDGSPFERRSFDELVYEEANQLRRAKLDFLGAYLFSPRVRGLPEISLYVGDLHVVDKGEENFAEKRTRREKVAAEPKALWEVLISSDPSLFPEPWQKDHYLLGALGASPARASQLRGAMKGVPVKLTAQRITEGAGLLVTESSIVRYEAMPKGEPLKGPSALQLEQARRREDQVKDPKALLQILAERVLEEEDSSAPSKMGLFLQLSAHMRREHLPEVLSLLRKSEDSLSQVELARVALRFDPQAAWPALRSIVLGKEGARAMSVVEALVAEKNDKALAALFRVLESRQEYTDVDGDKVALWGVEHAAALSGASLADLAALFPLSEKEASDPGAILALALDYWLRWWEKEKGKHPRL